MKPRMPMQDWVLMMLCLVGITVGGLLIDAGTARERAQQQRISATAERRTVVNTVPVLMYTYTDIETDLYADVPLEDGLKKHIIRQSNGKNIPPEIVFALIKRESDYSAGAIGDNGNSFGLMQIQPRWHRERMDKLLCTDLLDGYQNTTVGIDYLAELLDRHCGDMGKALVAYNQGAYKGTVTRYAREIMADAERIGLGYGMDG